MDIVDQIEYCLGKDSLPNLFWKPAIPNAWDIVTRKGIQLTGPTVHDTVLEQFGISYKFNNLGYRSNFDYNVEDLKTKELVLVLGDSDGLGRGVEFDSIFSSIIQQNVDYTVVNLSVPSLSADGLARIASNSIHALGPAVKHVCVLWPGMSTREFVSKKFQGGIYTEANETPYADWWDHIDWVNNNYNFQKNKTLLAAVVANSSAQFHDLLLNREANRVDGMFTKLPSLNLRLTQLTRESHAAVGRYFIRKIHNKKSYYHECKATVV
jgi:hypothetical protein